MDIETLVWSIAASLPHPYAYKNGLTKSVLTCSLTNLLQSSSQSSRSVWNSIFSAPVYHSTCVAVDGELLAVKGISEQHKTTSVVCKYNPITDSWDLISNIPTARSVCLVAVLPANEMMVLGGGTDGVVYTDCVEIVNIQFL